MDGASRMVLAMIFVRSRGQSLFVAKYPQDETTFEAMSVFSKSKTANCLEGSSTCFRSLLLRVFEVLAEGVVLTRPCVTTVGRWISYTYLLQFIIRWSKGKAY